MVSFDLRKAFDALPHAEIWVSLLEAGVDEALAATLVQVHIQTRCSIVHGGDTAEITMSRGLRQGCPVAPIIFAAWTARFFRLLRERAASIPTGGHEGQYSMFADDLHASWILTEAAGFSRVLRRILIIIDLLSSLGMSVNFQKSLVVLRLRGDAVAKTCRSALVWQDGAQHLRLRSGSRDVLLPILLAIPYLGAQLSYDNFELQTCKTRAQAAQQRFLELGRVLRSRSSLSTSHRLRLYLATVWPSLMYAIPYVGVNSEVFRLVVSTVSGHLRKILRVHEEGVSNLQVMQQAKVAPGEFLSMQIGRKEDSIRADFHRCPDMKAPELNRAAKLRCKLSEVLLRAGTSSATSVVSSVLTPVLESANLPCPECGVYYVTKEGLQMHIKHRHPHLNQQARLPFRRDEHSLFGLPICRFCKVRLFDWKSLGRHITTGTCLRIKEFLAEGLSEPLMLQRLAAEESAAPTAPPDGAQSGDAVHAQVEDALRMPNFQLATQGESLRVLARHCALCKQIIKDAGKIKVHWGATHPKEYAAVKSSAEAEARSLVAVFRSPCHLCGSGAKQARGHAGKCASLFQLLAMRQLRARGFSSPVPSCGPALKQGETTPQYQLYRQHTTPLGRAFGLRPAADDVDSSERARAAGDRPVREPPTAECFPPAGVHVGAAPRLEGPWLTELRLQNPSNSCFMNATVLALLHAAQGASWQGRALRSLYEIAMQAVASSSSVSLSSQLIMRAMLPAWAFDGRQHDAAEFALSLLGGMDLTFGCWESRTFEEEQLVVPHQGVQPIVLAVYGAEPTLELLIRRWHRQEYLHALVDVPGVLLLQIARYGGGRKPSQSCDSPEISALPCVFKLACKCSGSSSGW